MNLHNMTHKSLFDSYLATPPSARCYSSKANFNSFTSANFNSSGSFNIGQYFSNVGSVGIRKDIYPSERVMTSYSTMQDPIFKIVGGFVGSKSQVGATNHRGREFSLWDVIVDKVIDIMDQADSKASILSKTYCEPSAHRRVSSKLQGFAVMGVTELHTKDIKMVKTSLNCLNSQWSSAFNRRDEPLDRSAEETEDLEKCKENTCAPPPVETGDCEEPDTSEQLVLPAHETPTPGTDSNRKETRSSGAVDIPSQLHLNSSVSSAESFVSESEEENGFSSSYESNSSETCPRRRLERTISECSADSDDSFIVFEGNEDEPVLSEESDDEDNSCQDDIDELDNCLWTPFHFNLSPPPPLKQLSRLEEANKKWNKAYSKVARRPEENSSKKNVQFVEGKNMVKVRNLIAWDFAHRAARINLSIRDIARFKDRIFTASSVLSPILSPSHREKIYAQRFQT